MMQRISLNEWSDTPQDIVDVSSHPALMNAKANYRERLGQLKSELEERHFASSSKIKHVSIRSIIFRL